MKIKKVITFSDLRDKGISSLDIKDDEVIQMKSKDKMLCIIDQSYLLELEKIKQESHKMNHQSIGSIGLFGASSSLFSSDNKLKAKASLEDMSFESRLSKLEDAFEKIKKNK